MISLRTQRLWLGLLAISLIVLLVGQPILQKIVADLREQKNHLAQDEHDARAALDQLRDDIATTERLQNQISEEEVNHALAPVDRLRAAQKIERLARHHAIHAFAYSFGPEENTLISKAGATPLTLALTTLTLNGEVMTDLGAFTFLDAIPHTLPGNVRLVDLVLERPNQAVDTPLHLSARFIWLSNGTKKPAFQTAFDTQTGGHK